MKKKKVYTWEQINTALINKGYSAKRIADILSELVKNSKLNN